MKSCCFLILAAFWTNSCISQVYISLAPSITNSAGTFAEKSNLALEVGRQWDVFSLGLDIGKTSLQRKYGRDSTVYLEVRPNLNVFQQGKFTNTFTAGIGYIFNAKLSLMTELTSGIEYSYNSRVHFNVNFGQYYYSGRVDATDVTFLGISAIVYFLPTHAKSLFKPPGKQQQ